MTYTQPHGKLISMPLTMFRSFAKASFVVALATATLAPITASAGWYVNQPVKEVRIEKDAVRIFFADLDKSKCWKHGPADKRGYIEVSLTNKRLDDIIELATVSLVSGKSFRVWVSKTNRCFIGGDWKITSVSLYS